MPRLAFILAGFLAATTTVQAQSVPGADVTALGDNHRLRIVTTGPGAHTLLDLDGDGAWIDVESSGGAQTRVIAHGDARVGLHNQGGPLAVLAGACPAPLTPSLTPGAGFAIITCH